MGVPGLWDLLRPAAVRSSLQSLAREAFLANRNGLRAYTIGIDASIWIFHAQQTHAGSNPFLRTLFFKIAQLLQHPVLPVFVFDGPNKPVLKRGRNIRGRFGVNDAYSKRFKELLDACGLEWWNAPGEAEAELALMNRQGKIDAVLSDDVDALLFGATCILRNNSPTLSGSMATRPGGPKFDPRHYEVYRASSICAEWSKEDSALRTEEDCRMAMVLIGLFSGGDYNPDGVANIGPTIAMGLAHAGYSDVLKLYNIQPRTFAQEIVDVHGRMIEELRTNNSTFIGRKNPARADKLADQTPEDVFPSFPLESYLKPVISSEEPGHGWPGFGLGEASSTRGKARYGGRWHLESAARACEQYFEWATPDGVCKKFAVERSLFCGEIVHEARERVMKQAIASRRHSNGDGGVDGITSHFANITIRSASTSAEPPSDLSTEVPAHLLRIHSARDSPHSDDMVEYRLGFKPDAYIERCHDAMDGLRRDPVTMSPNSRGNLGLVDREATDAEVFTAKDEIRTWIPEYLVLAAWPALIDVYKGEEAAKAAVAAHEAAQKAERKAEKEAKKAAKEAELEAKRLAREAKLLEREAKKGHGRSPKKKQAVTTENAEAFRQFFISSPAKAPAKAVPTLSPPTSPSPIVAPAPVRVHAANILAPVSSSPPLPTSHLDEVSKRSLSAVSASTREATPDAVSGRSPRRQPNKITRIKKPSTPVLGKSATSGNADDPIDLCDSDSEPTPKPRRTVGRPRRSPSPKGVQASAADNVTAVASSPAPPKESSPKKTLVKKTPPKRSPGRSRKSTPAIETTASPKRGPGRPRTTTLFSPQVVENIEQPSSPEPTPPPSPTPVRRSVGRPPKTASPVLSASPAPARRSPGRPRKQIPASPTDTTQTILDSLIVARPRKVRTTKTATPRSKFTVEVDEKGVERIYVGKARPEV